MAVGLNLLAVASWGRTTYQYRGTFGGYFAEECRSCNNPHNPTRTPRRPLAPRRSQACNQDEY